MIEFEHTDVTGWAAAVRGMRNPKNSWMRSDSAFVGDIGGPIYLGDADRGLMQNLADSGSDHGKFLRFITVTVDIRAPWYWWKEFDTYKVGTVSNSCSTMHKITERDLTLDDFAHNHMTQGSEWMLTQVINQINWYRKRYLQTKDKADWWQIIQMLPSSYMQRRTLQMNYAVLRNMYHARRLHKLDEWHDFCWWISRLPYSELITGENKKED